MLKQLVGLLALSLGCTLVAQVPNAPTVPAAPTVPSAARLRSSDELEKLVAPIALYPDSLVALILPAATESADIVMAARYLVAGRDPAGVDSEPWDDSVKSLARYPDIVKWMDTNLEWTRDIGDAFLAQPSDVMNAVQRLRLSARSSGVLNDTPEQRVLVEADEVRIVPARVDTIYIPYYDPDILFMRGYYGRPLITFSAGFAIGRWLYFDCDWRGRSIWVHHHHLHPSWVYTPGWRPPVTRVVVAGRPAPVVWAPRPHVHVYSRPPSPVHRPVVYPRPMPRPDHNHPPAPPPRTGPGHRGDERPQPAPSQPSTGPRKPYLPTPPPTVSNPAPQPGQPTPSPSRPSEWRDRPRGQVPSHGNPTGPTPRTETSRPRGDEGQRRSAPAPSKSTTTSSQSKEGVSTGSSTTSSEESKPARGDETGRGRTSRPQQ